MKNPTISLTNWAKYDAYQRQLPIPERHAFLKKYPYTIEGALKWNDEHGEKYVRTAQGRVQKR